MRKALVKRGGQIIEVDVDDNHVNQLHKAQTGGQGSGYPLNDMGEEIRYHKEFDRRGKRITKEKLVTPADLEEGTKSTTRYVKRILDDNGQGRTISRPSGLDYFINPFHANFFGAPRDGSYIDNEINPNFNHQPRMFQMGGAPQEQMAQQQMPPQQEGQAQSSEQDQVMQLIQAYAQAKGISPEEIIQQLQQMDPQAQQQAIQQMAKELQGGQPQQEMPPQETMQDGGNSKGGSPLDMLTPEYKNKYFADLTKQFGQINHDKAFMKDLQKDFQKFQSGGYVTDANGKQSYTLGHGFDPMKLDKAYQFQNNADELKAKGNTGEAFWNLFGTVAKSAQNLKSGISGMGAKPAAGGAAPTAQAPATGAPAATPAVPAAGATPAAAPAAGGTDPMKAISSIFGGGGGGAAGAAGGMDLSALAGFLRYGGSLPTAGEGGLFKKIIPIAAGVAGTAVAGPIGGMIAKKAVSGMTEGSGGGAPAAGGGGGGFDPSALVSMFAKRGGSLPRYQSNVTTGQVNPFMDLEQQNFMNGITGEESGVQAMMPKKVDPKFGAGPNWSANEQGKITNNISEDLGSGFTKYKTDWDGMQQPGMGFQGFMQATKGVGPATAGFVEAWGNKRKAKKAQNFADRALLSDNLATATTGNMLDRGDYVTNTQLANANFRPDKNIPMGYDASEFGKYGMQLAKTGTQVQNPYMSNPYSHPEAILYGEPDPKISNTLKPVKREHANLEAEVGEVAVTPGGPDGVPKFFKIGGKNHYDGGTPLSLPENTFIFSKTRSMIIKDPKILKELTGSTKPASPADLAKKFDYSEYVAVLQNENSDPVERKTAQMMIESMMYKLGQIAIIQEAKKGFPSGIPLVAVPYLEKAGIDPQMLLPKTQQEPQQGDPRMQQQMDPAMQEQMGQQPQQQMDPRMMQEQMEPMPEGQEPMGQPESMEQYPTMQSGGGYKSYEDMKMKMNAARAAMPAKPMLTPEQQRAQNRQIMGQIGEIFRSHDQGPDRINPTFPRQSSYTSSLDYAPTPYSTSSFAYGGTNLERYQTKGQVSNSAVLNRISKDLKTYPLRTNKDSLLNNSREITNYPLRYNTDSLGNYLPWNDPVPEDSSIFDNYKPEFRMTPYRMGGSNIMGSPVLPVYQTAGQFDDLNFAQKVLSGKNPITNQTSTAKKESGAYMPEAWGIYAKAMNSRNIEEIKKAAEYMKSIDVPYNLGWMPWQTEQDTFENAAGALEDRANMLENDTTQASINSKQFEEKKQLSEFRNKLIQLKKSTPNTLENIEKIKQINTALQETSRFSFSNNSYQSPLSLINAYQSLFTNSGIPNNKKEKAVSTTKMSADSVTKSTPAPVQVKSTNAPVESKTKSNQSKPSKFKKVEGEDLNLF